jgi:hypothetical protein
MDMWTMRLNGAGLARGQREYTLPTVRSFDHMTTALYDDEKIPTAHNPIHWPRLKRIDSLRVADLRPLQAHT